MYTNHFKYAESPTGYEEGELRGLMKLRQDSWTEPRRTNTVSTREDTDRGGTTGVENCLVFPQECGQMKLERRLGFGCAVPLMTNLYFGAWSSGCGDSLQTLNMVRIRIKSESPQAQSGGCLQNGPKGKKSERGTSVLLQMGVMKAWTKAVPTGIEKVGTMLWMWLNRALIFTGYKEMREGGKDTETILEN